MTAFASEDVLVLTAPETWTPEDVDEWLAEAHDTLRRLHVRKLGTPHNIDNRPAPPSAEAIAHLDQVDRWLRWLTVEQRWVVRRRAAGLSWRQVSRSHWRDRGRRRGVETLRRAYWGAVGRIVVRLNAMKKNQTKETETHKPATL